MKSKSESKPSARAQLVLCLSMDLKNHTIDKFNVDLESSYVWWDQKRAPSSIHLMDTTYENSQPKLRAFARMLVAHHLRKD
ncbi:MAG: hypothetical protein KDA89_09035, partial [Planctomycetaceae bacterium]|nr:hypothetical protein [Planctomycetaceae bacterium]